MTTILSDPHRRHLTLTALVAVGLVVYLTGAVTTVYGFDLALLLALAGGFPIYSAAVTELLERKISADLAVGIAAIAALTIGQYAVAAEVILIMLIGEALENFAVGRTRSAIEQLLALRPQEARVRRDGSEIVVPIAEIRPDDVVLVRPGDRVPVDGRVVAGTSSIDQSPITGESLPADKAPGDEVFAGTINQFGALAIAVERLGADTQLEHIIRLVEEAEEAKAPTERLADRYATWFVPVVLLVAAGTWLLTRDVVRSVAVLVVACPCALVLATPTAVAAGIGRLVRRGVLVKGGGVLERLARLKAVVLDKTGTLTEAKLRIAKVLTAAGEDESAVLRLAAAVERNSEHPIGSLIVERARAQGIDAPESSDFRAHPGLGALATLEGQVVRVGNPRFLDEFGVRVSEALSSQVAEMAGAGCTVVLVARGDEAVGAVAVQDTVRPDALAMVERLRSLGVERLVMLTGDNAAAARSVASVLGIDDVRSELLPAQKVEAVRAIQVEAAPLAMVGDGINDAPSLVAADVGVAMADIGTDVAIESADVILMGDRLEGFTYAVATGHRVLRTIWQNIIGAAFIFNAIGVALASLGWISPIVAAVMHQVSSLLVCLNSLRLLADWGRCRARLAAFAEQAWARRRRIATAGGVALLVLWLLSGVHFVGIGQVAVVQRFGRVVQPLEQPGLHVRLPWPFAWHSTVDVERIRRVEIGFRTLPGDYAEPAAYEWNLQHRGGRNERRPEEADVWTGDDRLVDVTLVVHYRIASPLAALFQLGTSLADGQNKWDLTVRAAAESSLHATMSRRRADDALSETRADIESEVLELTRRLLADYGTGIEVTAVCLGDVHPPFEVVPDYRDVAKAMGDKAAKINQAQAYANKTEALARGRAAERETVAAAFAVDREERAAGQSERFAKVAKARAAAPELTRLRLYLETIEQALAGRRKIIFDRAAGRGRRLLYLGRKGLWTAPPPAPTEPEGPVQP